MNPKFQKRSVLKFVGRIIPITKLIGISSPALQNIVKYSLGILIINFKKL